MDTAFWESVADNYDSEIFSVLACDRDRSVLSCLESVASRAHTAADLGCGVGKWLPELATRFASVLAADHSEKLLAQAKRAGASFDNISYLCADLTQPGYRLGKHDFVLCVNVAIMPDAEQRWNLLGNIARCLRPGGHLLLVVPSLESALFVKQRLVQWRLRRGSDEKEAWAAEAEKRFASLRDVHQGIVQIERVRTKHYLREELITTLDPLRLAISHIGKVEYRWDTEFTDPPRWMRSPHPWDWMVLAQKP